MTLAHAACAIGFSGVIAMSVWTIADSFRKEWPRVRRTFAYPPASTAPQVEASPRPAGRPPVAGGATGSAI